MTAPTSMLLPRRSLYLFVIAAATGISAGVLTYVLSRDVATAVVAGILAAGSTIGWLQAVNWSALRNWHGVGLGTISVLIGSGICVVLCLGDKPWPMALLGGVSAAALALVGLQKISP